MRSGKYVLDIDHAQFFKHGQRIGGDVFLSSRNPERNRIVCTLSDGLGSGVKANVLASLTSHMAEKLSFSPINAVHSAEIIMNTLPVCKERKISYSTFSMIRITFGDRGRIKAQLIEYDNPPMFLFSVGGSSSLERQKITLKRKSAFKEECIHSTELELSCGQRLVMFTDGVSQAGLGTPAHPLGWRRSEVEAFIRGILAEDPDISSKDLADTIIRRARHLDGGFPKDDITCAVVTVRRPRDLLIATGPPYQEEQDDQLVREILAFNGRKIVSGGTTAMIVSRVTGNQARVDLSSWNPDIPPASRMDGIDLVTEGMLTLNQVAVELERRSDLEELPKTAVSEFLRLLMGSDRVYFLVGTKINEAHQDPNIPFEIGIRRTIVQRIRNLLEEHYLKETSVSYI